MKITKSYIKLLGYDSFEELYFDWWLNELKTIGLIKSKVIHPTPFTLFEEVTTGNGTNKVERHIYTPDFKVTWNKESKWFLKLCKPFWHFLGKEVDKNHILFHTDCSYIEIKPLIRNKKGKIVDPHNSIREFKINQKWVLMKYSMYVQMIKPIETFRKTFYPVKYLATDAGKKAVNYKLINDFFK